MKLETAQKAARLVFNEMDKAVYGRRNLRIPRLVFLHGGDSGIKWYFHATLYLPNNKYRIEALQHKYSRCLIKVADKSTTRLNYERSEFELPRVDDRGVSGIN